jgi:hypothetical protein
MMQSGEGLEGSFMPSEPLLNVSALALNGEKGFLI